MTKHRMPKHLENASEFRHFVYELTESKSFGAFILFVILVNTIILLVQTDETISIKGGKYYEHVCFNLFGILVASSYAYRTL